MTPEAPRARFTPREQQVAELVSEGMTNAQIAAQLGIAVQTVRHTLVRVFDKAQVSNRAALTRFWLTAHVAANGRRGPLNTAGPAAGDGSAG